MTDTQLSPDHVPADGLVPVAAPAHRSTRRFRGASYDDAFGMAVDELGPEVEVLEANRIRRGGLGGFFATDLGVEITVTTPALAAAGPVDADRTGAERRGAGWGGAGRGAIGDVTDPVDAGAVRPYLPEDLGTPDRGSLAGQALGMTDARLQQLLDRAEETERSQLPPRRPGTSAFADAYADQVRAQIASRADPEVLGTVETPAAGPAAPAPEPQIDDPVPMDAAISGAGAGDVVPGDVTIAAAGGTALGGSAIDETAAADAVVDGIAAGDGAAGSSATSGVTTPGVVTDDVGAGDVVFGPGVAGVAPAGALTIDASTGPRLPGRAYRAVVRTAPSGFLGGHADDAVGTASGDDPRGAADGRFATGAGDADLEVAPDAGRTASPEVSARPSLVDGDDSVVDRPTLGGSAGTGHEPVGERPSVMEPMRSPADSRASSIDRVDAHVQAAGAVDLVGVVDVVVAPVASAAGSRDGGPNRSTRQLLTLLDTLGGTGAPQQGASVTEALRGADLPLPGCGDAATPVTVAPPTLPHVEGSPFAGTIRDAQSVLPDMAPADGTTPAAATAVECDGSATAPEPSGAPSKPAPPDPDPAPLPAAGSAAAHDHRLTEDSVAVVVPMPDPIDRPTRTLVAAAPTAPAPTAPAPTGPRRPTPDATRAGLFAAGDPERGWHV